MPDFNEYKKLLSSNPENKRYFELVTITHPDLTKTYRFVANNVDLTSSGLLYEKASIRIDRAVTSNDLDQSLSFTFADVLNVLDDELKNIPLDTATKPTINYKLVLSDDVDVPVEDITFDIKSVAQEKGVFTAITGAPDLNRAKTGEIYDYNKFPMLRTATL